MSFHLITNTTITTETALINFPDVFTDKYDCYAVTAFGFTASDNNVATTECKLYDTSGSIITNTNYDWGYLRANDYGTANEARDEDDARWDALWGKFDQAVDGDSQGGIAYFYNPFASDKFTHATWQSVGGLNGQMQGPHGMGVLSENTSVAGFQIDFLSTNTQSGTVSVYGVN